MRRLSLMVVFLLAVSSMFLPAAGTAEASGYPMAIIFNDPSTGSGIVVGKFGSGFTSVSDANNVASIVGEGIALLGLGSAVSFYSPTQLAGFGLSDADALKSLVKGAYVGAGLSLYIFLDIKRTSGVSPSLGNNIRMDIWVADVGALIGFPEDGGYLYVTSIEVPEAYLALAAL